MANNFTGRQIIINTTGVINIPANLKVGSGWWEGMTAPATFSFTDAAGRAFSWQAYQTNYPIDIGKLDWLEGPLTITAIGSGQVYMILTNK